MLSLDVGEEEFFDTVGYLSSEESFGVREDLGYDIWLNEPLSVKERRSNFLRKIGFPEMDRITECSGAVSSSCETIMVEESLSCERREFNGDATSTVDEFDEQCIRDSNVDLESETLLAETSSPIHPEDNTVERSSSAESLSIGKKEIYVCERNKVDVTKKKMRRWWKHFTCQMRRRSKKTNASDVPNVLAEAGEVARVKVRQNKKHYMELSAVYARQEISAHKGLIWTMKFSPDGQLLASGGEDGVVRIWRVKLTDTSCITTDCNYVSLKTRGKLSSKMEQYVPIVLPNKVLHIEETPVQEFHGHTSDVLDLAWSSSTLLLSSSKDKTVRLWQVGSDQCVDVFSHNNYVTCIQFNPADENYFISGSIDGKVRIWGVRERRVVNWADVHDIVTTLCYQPNAKGFVVGSVSGTCHFYEVLGNELSLNAELQIHGRKKSSGNRITGIQFLENDPQRVMITSEDSKIRILDGLEVVHKYKGLAKSGSQMSASFTSSGRHIVSVGEDSRIYIWNYDEMQIRSSRQAKSIRSCEHFFSDTVSVAIPWSTVGTEQTGLDRTRVCYCLQKHEHQAASSWLRDSERFSLENWFSMDGLSRVSVTWPEEKLPSLELSFTEHGYQPDNNGDHCLHQQLQHHNTECNCGVLSTTYGLVIVAAGLDGTIRTFQNYGLPVRA